MKNRKINAPLGASLVVLSSLFYASYGVWTKLLGDYFAAFTQAALRHMVTASILIASAILLRQFGRIHWRRDAGWFALSALTSAIIPASLYYAILNAGLGVGLSLAYIGIVIGMFFFGWMFARERFTRDKWLSTALGIGGVLLVFAPSLSFAGWLPLVAAFGGGITTGLNIVIAKKLRYSASQTAAIVWTLGVFANIPLVFVFSEPVDVFHWDIAWLYLVVFGVVSVVASWSMIKGVKLIEAGAAGILGLLEVVFGVLFGVVLFAERPQPIVIVGMLCILLAAAIPYVKDYNAKKGTLEEKKA